MSSAIEATYRARTTRSAEVMARSERVLPAGETRAATYHPPYSLAIERGSGAHLWDVDGNEYVDLNNNYTCLVHGNAYPPVVEAATRAVADGTTWAAKNPHQVELAELLVDRVASVEQVRFMNSGSEAVALALTMARAITGRYKVLMARYGFHGQHEAFNDGLFRGKMPPWPDTYVATFGDADEFEQVLTDHGDEIAAVFLEPVMAAAGLVSAPAEFFHRVQRAADAAGALFVLDEASVFRLATGGMQEGLGVTPDLTVLGKMVGGGFPVGAVGGRRDVMAVLDPRAGILASSSTFAGNPVAMAAGVVAVRDLDADAIFRLEGISQQLDEAITARAAAAGLPFSLRRVGSLINVYFSPEPPEANQVRTDHDLMTRFHLAALNRGVFMVPRGLVNPSTAVTSDDLGIAIDRLGDAIDDVAADVANGAPPITV